MSFEKLQIKLLSKRGELLSSLSCPAGRLTVFRAFAPADLLPYQRALCGRPGPERFVITLDTEEFNPNQHISIGFGEKFLPADGTVQSYFMSTVKIAAQAVSSRLASVGLQDLADLPCDKLDRCQERRLRLLCAQCSTDQVLVMHEPFDPVSVEWRERLAELFVTLARTRKAIILVTSTSYRPECWIDNETINRLQVGENLQKTIGFSTESSSAILVNQMRVLLKNEVAVQEILREDATNDQQQVSALQTAAALSFSQFFKEKKGTLLANWAELSVMKKLLYLTSTLTVGVASSLIFFRSNSANIAAHKTPQQVNMEQSVQVAAIKQTITTPANMSITPTAPAIDKEQYARNMPAVAAEDSNLILNEYPVDIKNAIILTYEQKMREQSTDAAIDTSSREVSKPLSNSSERSDLLRMLEGASGAEAPSQPGADPEREELPSTADENFEQLGEEQKREVIRQRFLEAIRKAAERRQEESTLFNQ